MSEPDEDDLRSFLLAFRSFVSHDELVFVNAIYNALWLQLEGDPVRTELAKARAVWRNACKSGAVALNVDGRDFATEDILDFWINGLYFHMDTRKRAALTALGPMGVLLARYKFLDHLVVGTSYVNYLRNVITCGRSEGLLTV